MFRRAPVLLCVLVCCAVSCSKSSPDKFSVKRWIKGQQKEAPAYSGPKVRLALKLTPGSYTVTESLSAKRQTQSADNAHNVQESIEISGDVDISKPDSSGGQTVRYVCRRVKKTVSAGGRTKNFDSAGPAKDQPEDLARQYRPFVGWQVTAHARNGKYTKTEESKDLMKRLADALPEGNVRHALPNARRMMQSFLEGLLKGHWGKLLPKDPVGPGDQWAVQFPVKAVPFLGDATFDFLCTLVDIEETAGRKIARIALAAQATVKDQEVDLTGLGTVPLKATVDKMEFNTTGTALFDLSIGLCVRTMIEMKAQGTMFVRGEEDKTATVEIKIAAKAETTLTKRESPAPEGTAADTQ